MTNLISDFKQEKGTKRILCGSCNTIANYPEKTTKDNFKCSSCGQGKYSNSSEDFDDPWIINQRNQKLKEQLEGYLAEVNFQIENFETQWFKSWNTNETVDSDWEEPEDITKKYFE